MKHTVHNNRGFTLVELMVVLALTIVVLGLVFGPVIKTFDFTRRAEIMVRAQDNARYALEQVSRELADAMYVYDNTNQPVIFPMKDASGNKVMVPVMYAKVDFVLPRMRGFCHSANHPANQPREFPRHLPNFPELDDATPSCPYDGTPLELRPVQPLAADTYVVRYFIGLRDPSLPYSNGYTNKFSEAADNMYVLYRVEFSPFDPKLFGNSTDVSANLSDPNFFYGPHSAAWRQLARAIVTLESTDLIVQEFQTDGTPRFDPVTGFPVITPTVKFTPTAIYNDPLVPTTESDDDPEHGDTPPAVYKASYGYWTTPVEVTLFRKDPLGGATITYRAVRQPGGACTIVDPAGHLVFDVGHYLQTKSDPAYVGSKYGVGEILPTNPEVAFTVDELKGTVNFAFPVVDINTSESLGSTLGKMAVSLRGSTDQINADYDTAAAPGGFRDRYRRMLINPMGSAPVANATVVAGSEKVIAPDASPGPRHGQPTQYGRMPTFLYEPGLNQYQMDLAYEPVDAAGNPTPVPGLAALFFHSYQTSQPGSGMLLPTGTDNVFVSYQVQDNKSDDSLRANYITKSLMTVIMGIRIYEASTGKPQSIQLTDKVRLRNIAR